MFVCAQMWKTKPRVNMEHSYHRTPIYPYQCLRGTKTDFIVIIHRLSLPDKCRCVGVGASPASKRPHELVRRVCLHEQTGTTRIRQKEVEESRRRLRRRVRRLRRKVDEKNVSTTHITAMAEIIVYRGSERA